MKYSTPYPESKEKIDQFVGIKEVKGDALTFNIFTDDANAGINC
jgi:hypothetical protein